jgi:Icc protein
MLRVLHLTDTHVVATEAEQPPASFADAVASIQGRTTTELLRSVVDAVLADGFDPDLVLHTGDATDDGEPASCAVLRRELDALGAPVVAVPGNHDRADLLAQAFDREAVDVRSVDLGAWQVVAVDCAEFGRGNGELGPDALAALDAALDAASGHVLIGLHHPPISVCSDPYCQLLPADEVLALIDRHPNVRAVVSGHLHVTDAIERGGVAYLLSPSTCLQLRHEHPLQEHNRTPTPLGARLLELHDDGRVESRLLWV